MIDHVAPPGENVSRTAAVMADLAADRGDIVHCEFNGIGLVATPGMNPDVIVDAFWAEIQRRADEYEASAEGKARRAERQATIEARQRQVDGLVLALPTLLEVADVTLAAIHWLQAFAEVADDVDVDKPSGLILRIFARAGYEPNVNVGDEYKPGDRENVGRWLIGQGLDGIRSVGSPHPILLDFADQWEEEFNQA